MISADLPFAVAEACARQSARSCVPLYTVGACGDLNHIDVSSGGTTQKGDENAARMGTILSGEVPERGGASLPVSGVLQVKTRTVELELPRSTPRMSPRPRGS